MTAKPALTPDCSGVYRTPHEVAGLRERAAAAGLAWLEADLGSVRTKPVLLAALAGAAGFPDSFGHNWDALHDSLSDFSWRPAGGYVLHLRNTAAAQRALGADWTTLLEVLRKAANDWKARAKPFVALIDGGTELPAWQ